MSDIEFVFIILHYQVIAETMKCIDSIMRLDGYTKCKILIVDNASPNGTGYNLKELFGENLFVDVLINEINQGFSRANNIGYIYAKEKWDPKFYIFLNNDIFFPQKNLLHRIKEKYEKDKFDVLGPDIFSLKLDKHQSPLYTKLPKLGHVKKSIILNTIVLKTWCLSRYLVKIRDRISGILYKEPCYYVEQKDVCIMGACIVFSKEVLDIKGKPFEPETFFYYEENLLYLWCKKHAKSMVYAPDIKVLHSDGVATYDSGDTYKRLRFHIEQMLLSMKVYRDAILEE